MGPLYLIISDDLTGAAEVGGVAVRYGVSAEVHIDEPVEAESEAIAVDTGTRLVAGEKAARRIRELAGKLKTSLKRQVYKKVDSVLRGPVLSELAALADGLEKRRVLLVPCNPGLGRTITQGRYWIKGRPIDETDFRNDPEHPARTSDVLEMLGQMHGGPRVFLRRPDEALPEHGIIVGEAASAEDLSAWARRVDSGTIPAGAAEFFGALLVSQGCHAAPSLGRVLAESETVLIVSGTATGRARQAITELEGRGVPVLRMPAPVYEGSSGESDNLSEWASQVVEALGEQTVAVVAIGHPVRAGKETARRLSDCLAHVTAEALARGHADHLWVEGGATAAEIIRHLGWRRLEVKAELSPGVVRLQPRGLTRPLITLKPGSYEWPEAHALAGARGSWSRMDAAKGGSRC